MTTASSHLLEILNCIFKSNSLTDEKNWFKNWIKKWIVGKESVQQVFGNTHDENNNNDNSDNIDEKVIQSLNMAHNTIHVKYSQCFFTYNYEFITDIHSYISTVYYDFFNQNSNELKICINLLSKLKQNMFYESSVVDNVTDTYPKIQYYSNKFENYGRAFMKYYNFKRVPFIVHVILNDSQFQLNDCKEKLKFNLYNFIEMIISNNDEDWLEFLHGPLLDIRYALYVHTAFCNKYQRNIWSYDIHSLLNSFNDYLSQIYLVILHEKYFKNKSLIKDICFPTISKIENTENPLIDFYNLSKNSYKDCYYNKTFELVPLMSTTFCGEHYEYILKNFIPSLRTKFNDMEYEKKDKNDQIE